MVPEWILLIPAGSFEGRDGRKFANLYPHSLIEATKELGLELVLDFNHQTDFATPKGDPAPAAGWMRAFEVRDGAIWARVEWTDKGREAVASKEYRYISPVFALENGEVRQIFRAGLTNSPNLHGTAICTEGFAINSVAIPVRQPKETTMLSDEDRKMAWLLGQSEAGFVAMRKQVAKQIIAARAAREGGELTKEERKDAFLDTKSVEETDEVSAAMDHLLKRDDNDGIDHVTEARNCLNRHLDGDPSAAASMRRITFRG